MKKCYDCTHVEMCGWRKEVEEHGCEFFSDGIVWIPVSERLPDLKTEAIYSFDGIVGTGYMTDRDYNGEKTESHWEDIESGVTIEPTHWMPLPEPYKGGDNT